MELIGTFFQTIYLIAWILFESQTVAIIAAIWFALLLIFAIVTTVWPKKWKWAFLYISEFLSIIAGIVVLGVAADLDDLLLIYTSFGIFGVSVFLMILTSILWNIADRKKRKQQEA